MNSIGLCRQSVVHKLLFRMFSVKHSYEDAVHKLNSLQSNKATLDQVLKDIRTGKKCTNIEDMEKYLWRTGVTLTKLDELSVIHVAGTKGKGSTSAMCESILRHHGYKTGFYSSPHLIAVRERIRLNGRALSEDEFARHFHQVYDNLEASKAYDGDMPKYFWFLTVMAFHVFLKEKVDVAIVEVGIGGLLDATNVLRKVPVVGITALGLDHTAILGDSLPQIAAAKAGIMKAGCEAYTVEQPPEAMAVLNRVAQQLKCSLNIVPTYDSYNFPNGYKTRLQTNLEAYRTNASLAIQLAHSWLRWAKLEATNKQNVKIAIASGKVLQNDYKEFDVPYQMNGHKCLNEVVYDGMTTQIPLNTAEGLKECKWPGRYQIVESTYATFYLDGAHTKESMEICSEWFQDTNKNAETVLVFSATGDRNSEVLLSPLSKLNFKQIYFVIPTAYKRTGKHNDNYSAVEHKDLLARCQRNAEVWEHLKKGGSLSKISILESVSEALIDIKSNSHNINRTSVLVTGSLHLVGATLLIIDPNLSST
ncbi:hypothetical protein evm_000114 [Chilo suppressalis]|nr:hypothetical protein evm_000114 [Chilo suppressalis]